MRWRLIATALSTLIVAAPADAATIRAVPLPPGGRQGELRGITCVKSGDCWLAGDYTKSTNAGNPLTQIGLVVHYARGRLRPMRVPKPPGAAGAELSDIGCWSDGNCWGVGSSSTSMTEGLWVAHWNGHRWTTVTARPPAAARTSLLSDISCLNSHVCLAVGGWADSHGEFPIVEFLKLGPRGVAGAARLSPRVPSGAIGTSFSGIRCLSRAGVCELAGFWTDSSGVGHTLAERWSGHSWRIQHSADYPGAFQSQLVAVDCIDRSHCLAAGSWVNAEIWTQPLAERWDGHTWGLTSPPRVPAGATDATFNGLSCVKANKCLAFGSSSNGSTGFTLAERWNGSSWSIVSTASPSGVVMSQFTDGVCPSAHRCLAAGFSSATSSGGLQPFLETLGVS